MSKLTNIHPDAKIGKNVKIDAFVTIEADVVIGDNTWIGPNAVIMNGSRIGESCHIFPGAVVGSIPQDLKFVGEYTTLEVGNGTTIREYCTINRGTKANYRTIIGENCLIMAYVHVAHDCILGDRVILANGTTLAGHVEVDDYARLSGMVAVHQFVKIGKYAMIAAQTFAKKDVPPYVLAAREPLTYTGVNSIGLRRAGFVRQQIHHIEDIYRTLYQEGLNTSQAVELIEDLEETPEKREILKFIKASTRGIIGRKRRTVTVDG